MKTLRWTKADIEAYELRTGRKIVIPPKKPKAVNKDPYKSNLEREFVRRLVALKLTGVILDWEYEPFPIELAPKCKYTPDFLITNLDGSQFIVETKGYCRRHDVTNFKVAADKMPQYRFIMITKKSGKLVKTRDLNTVVCDIAKGII